LAAEDPDAPAVVDVDGSVTTRGELSRRVHALSHALRASGLGIDDRVAVLVHNSVRYFDWMLAGAQIGLHPVPLNFHLAPVELAYIIENSGAKVLAAGADLVPLADQALAQIPFDGERVALDAAPGYTAYERYLAGHPTSPPPDRVSGGVMLYTAGTTGRPKGVLWPANPAVTPEAALAATAPMFRRRGMSVGGVSLVCGPLYHGAPGAQGMQGLHWGQTVVLMDRWNSEEALRLIEEHGVTHVQMAPIHFQRLLELPDEVRRRYHVSSLRAVTHAGAACPVDVKHRMMAWFGPVLYEYYAASEGYGTSISPQQWLEHPGSVGHVSSDGADVAIVGDDGQDVEAGEVGTVYLRLPGVGTSEYLGDPAKTAANERPGGFRTYGDMGYVDGAGWLFLVDRRSDLILSGGVNIYPAEVEQRLASHAAVADVAVVGVPDAEWGQSVLAVVVLADGVEPSEALEADLRRHCEDGLARFKCPRAFDFRTELPYSGAGKLLRREVRDPYWT
jgi:long-chain acyl-CoA synthetase